MEWSLKDPQTSASLCHTFLTEWISVDRGAPPEVRAAWDEYCGSAEFVKNVMREVLESGEEDLARKYAELSAASTEVSRGFNKKMRKLGSGESFQCPECGDLFLTTMVKWGAFLEHLKQNHPGATKPQRLECLVDVDQDGNVKPSGQKHNRFRRGGGFKPKRHQ